MQRGFLSFPYFLAFVFILQFAYLPQSEANLLDWFALSPTRGAILVRSSQGKVKKFHPKKVIIDEREFDELKITDSLRPTELYRYTNHIFTREDRDYQICIHHYENPPAHTQDKPDYYILNFGGIGRRAELGMNPDLLSRLPSTYRYEIWTVNYPGYGQTTGPATLMTLGQVARVSFDILREKAGDTPILLVGQSMGTAAALSVAANRKEVAGIFLRDVVSLKGIIRHQWNRFWNLWSVETLASRWLLPVDLDSVENAKQIETPTVLLSSEFDTTTPMTTQLPVVENYAGNIQHVILKDIDHEDDIRDHSTESVSDALNWLLKR